MRTLADIALSLKPIAAPSPATLPMAAAQPARAVAAVSPLGSLVYRPTLYRRNGVAWASVRSWRADAKMRDLVAFKRAKAAVDAAVIEAAAAEIAAVAGLLFGPLAGWQAVNIPCGHSRRPDCFGKRLAQRTAAQLGIAFDQLFADRFCSGVSHPKEFAKLPPLTRLAQPSGPALVIDDVATSGWHIEEALGALRGAGVPAFGLAWLSGDVR